jgi:hypothetical protein
MSPREMDYLTSHIRQFTFVVKSIRNWIAFSGIAGTLVLIFDTLMDHYH